MSRNVSKELLNDLKAVPLFAGCSDKELAEVSRLADEITIPPGSVVVRQGAFGSDVFVLLRGAVSVSINGTPVADLTDGSYFGEMAPLDHLPRSATVTAQSLSTMLVFGAREFSSLLASHQSVSRHIMSDMAHRLREANMQALAG